jgi:DNA-binding NarL/FixJ family response regulator
MPKSTAVLADDQSAFRAIVTRLLQRDFEVLANARDGVELVAAIETHHPDIVVADISMPLLNGIEAIHRAREAGSLNRLDAASTAVVFLTNHADQMLVERAWRVGGLGYVLKPRAAMDLLAAIAAARRGEFYVSPPLERPPGPTDIQ